jgi:hypothetical protein
MHGVDYVELRQPVVPDLSCHRVLRDDPLCLAARPQHRIREHAHQTHIAAAIDQPDVAPCQFSAQFLGSGAVIGAAPCAGTADSFHGAILRCRFCIIPTLSGNVSWTWNRRNHDSPDAWLDRSFVCARGNLVEAAPNDPRFIGQRTCGWARRPPRCRSFARIRPRHRTSVSAFRRRSASKQPFILTLYSALFCSKQFFDGFNPSC